MTASPPTPSPSRKSPTLLQMLALIAFAGIAGSLLVTQFL